jgi:segregation and condensation protein A
MEDVVAQSPIWVDGKLTEVPQDLYIPPDALLVLLESFSGPLDLLLYLIRKQNIDILNIPIVSITEQYMRYIHLMELKKLELAADYLLMAAMLAEIKSRLLLPPLKQDDGDDEEIDPRMELVKRLQAYEQMKHAAQEIEALPRQERDYFTTHVAPDDMQIIKIHPFVALEELCDALKSIMTEVSHNKEHQIVREVMSVRDRMVCILEQLQTHSVLEFNALFLKEEGRAGLVVSLLAILELARQSLLQIVQHQNFAKVYLYSATTRYTLA